MYKAGEQTAKLLSDMAKANKLGGDYSRDDAGEAEEHADGAPVNGEANKDY